MDMLLLVEAGVWTCSLYTGVGTLVIDITHRWSVLDTKTWHDMTCSTCYRQHAHRVKRGRGTLFDLTLTRPTCYFWWRRECGHVHFTQGTLASTCRLTVGDVGFGQGSVCPGRICKLNCKLWSHNPALIGYRLCRQ